MKTLSTDAAKILDAAIRELGLSRDATDRFLCSADRYAGMDYSETIEARHILGALGSRAETPGIGWEPAGDAFQRRTCA